MEAPIWLIDAIQNHPHKLRQRLCWDKALLKNYYFCFDGETEPLSLAVAACYGNHALETLAILIDHGCQIDMRAIRYIIELRKHCGTDTPKAYGLLLRIFRQHPLDARTTLLEYAQIDLATHIAFALVRCGAKTSGIPRGDTHYEWECKREMLRRSLVSYASELQTQRRALYALIGLRKFKRRIFGGRVSMVCVPPPVMQQIARTCWGMVE